jgi:Divergent InlB B-repeat domain
MAAANVGVPSVSVSIVGGGKVASSDRVIGCGSKCSASYDINAQVTLTASANSGSVFTGWTGACEGAGANCTLGVNEALTVTANFAPLYNLVVKTAGSGSVVSAPSAIDCGKTCSAKLTQGTRVTLTATPATGLKFNGWAGACSGTSLTCSVTVSKDTQVQANFK